MISYDNQATYRAFSLWHKEYGGMCMKTKQPTTRQLRDLPIYQVGAPLIGTTKRFQSEPLTFHVEPYHRYGPLYRIRLFNQTMLVMAGLEANEFVWRNSDLWQYGQMHRVFREGYDETCVLQLEGEPHRVKHRRMVQGFKPSALLPFAPEICDELFSTLAALPDEVPDLRILCKQITANITCYALLQASLPPGTNTKIDTFAHMLLLGNILGPLRHLWYKHPRYHRLKAELVELIEGFLKQRAEHPPAKDDILSTLLKGCPSGSDSLSHQEIVHDVLFLFQAGTVTTATLLLWSLLYLYQHPQWLAELREELCTWSPEQLTDLESWPKLKATIIELERLRPAEPFLMLTSGRDFEWHGLEVPRGTQVFHAAAVTHFLPEIYDDPLSFKPQRFLNGISYPPKTHATYGGGAHFCIGQPLARSTVALSLASIVTNYDLVFDPPPSLQPTLRVVITPAEPTLPVRFVPRRASA